MSEIEEKHQLDTILEKMVITVENSKNEVFEIGEQSRKELDEIKKELDSTKEKVLETIDQGDKLEVQTRLSRNRLSDVSRNFKAYKEQEVREAYEQAHSFHMKLMINRQKEQQLRERRDDLERRLRNIENTVERAEALVGQISVVLNYLNSDFRQATELINDAKQRQEFGLRIIEAQEEERRRLSREIHDGPAQMLANVMMRSELIERISREKGMAEALEEVRSLRVMVRSALYEVRKIIYDLRPMALDDLGLIPTLKRYIGTVEDYYKIKIVFNYQGESTRLPIKLEVAMFRLIQEAVQNACNHSKAQNVQVDVKLSKGAHIVVKDNGIGFDTSVHYANKFGLIGMRERVDLLKGELSIKSKQNKGTTITINVPLQESIE